MIRSEYDRRLATASEQVDLLGFGLRSFREDYGSALAELATRTRIRILLLHPEYPSADASYAAQRDTEERNHAGAIANDVTEFIIQTTDLRHQNPANFGIRLYKALPAINIFRIDDDMFWGPYLLDTQSRNTPTFLTRLGTLPFDAYQQHFDTLWTERWSIAADDF